MLMKTRMAARGVVLIGFLLACLSSEVRAQGCNFPLPKNYIVYHLSSSESITLDGKLDEPAWTNVAWTDPFQDIQGPSLPKPRFLTQAKMRYDDTYLYVGGYIQEPQIWANQTKHDSVIFYDNDFEVFIDPNWSNTYYKEFEINAINTWWNLYLNKPYLDGGSPTNDWDIVPIQTAVYVNGTVNDPSAKNYYWTVEIAFPHKALIYLQQNVSAPPKSGDQWRINFSRVEYHVTTVGNNYVKVPGVPEDNWVWSSQDVVNMHIPERWGFIQFSTQAINTTKYVPDPYWAVRNVLLQVYYAEREFNAVSGYYTADFTQLNLPDYIVYGKCASVPVITPNATTFSAYKVAVTPLGVKGVTGYILDDRQLWIETH